MVAAWSLLQFCHDSTAVGFVTWKWWVCCYFKKCNPQQILGLLVNENAVCHSQCCIISISVHDEVLITFFSTFWKYTMNVLSAWNVCLDRKNTSEENMPCPKGHKYDVKWGSYFVHFYKLFAAIIKAELEQELFTAGRWILCSLLANDITNVRCQCPYPGLYWLDNGKNGFHLYSISKKQPIKHPQALLMSTALSDTWWCVEVL